MSLSVFSILFQCIQTLQIKVAAKYATFTLDNIYNLKRELQNMRLYWVSVCRGISLSLPPAPDLRKDNSNTEKGPPAT